jgi:outer membrane protein OmpA-like peptidoglycan-associated protein
MNRSRPLSDSAQAVEGFERTHGLKHGLHVAMSLMLGFVLVFAPSLAPANVIGSDTQNFNTIPSGIDFVTVESSETLKPGLLNLGFFLNWSANTLPYFDESPQSRRQVNDTLIGSDFNMGLGLGRNWDIGLSLPAILRQSVDDPAGARGEFAQEGATEFRLASKYRLWGNDAGGFAVKGSFNFNRIVDNPYIGRGAPAIFNIEAIFDQTFGDWALGVNLGHRLRRPGEALPGNVIQPLGSQWIASVGASRYYSKYNLKLITEIFGSLPAQRTSALKDRSLSSLEWIVGLKYDWSDRLALHSGGGTELAQGVASPDWRLYAGLNYVLGPLWTEAPREPSQATLELVDSSGGSRRYRSAKITFAFDSDQLTGRYVEILEEVVQQGLERKFKRLVIEGHTDSVGGADYNMQLSLRRAEAIRRELISRFKMDGAKIQALGFGELNPIADNGNFQGRQANRRVEFEFID